MAFLYPTNISADSDDSSTSGGFQHNNFAYGMPITVVGDGNIDLIEVKANDGNTAMNWRVIICTRTVDSNDILATATASWTQGEGLKWDGGVVDIDNVGTNTYWMWAVSDDGNAFMAFDSSETVGDFSVDLSGGTSAYVDTVVDGSNDPFDSGGNEGKGFMFRLNFEESAGPTGIEIFRRRIEGY